MKLITMTALALLVAPPAFADSMKLSVEKVWNLSQALGALNGQGNSPYKLTAQATYSIAIDMSHLQPIIAAYQAALKTQGEKIAVEHPEDVAKGAATQLGQFVQGSPSAVELDNVMQPVWKGEQDVDIIRIKLADLNIGPDPAKQNQIAPAVLSALADILDP